MHPVRLVGAFVELREFGDDDIGHAEELLGDDRVTHWLSFDSRSRNEVAQMIREIIERAKNVPRTEYYLAVTLPGVDTVMGFARLGLNGVQAAKLGYAIHADHWNNGYATDAVRSLIEFGFTKLKLHRISAAVGPDNKASIHVVRLLGFQYEGLLRDHVWTNGAWRDSQLYSILAGEWPPAGRWG